MLYIFGGLPGAGKSTLAASFARERRALYLRIDTIEQVLRDAETPLSGPQGYSVAYRIAADNLRLGLDVVADSVNPLGVTRDAWRQVAEDAGVPFVEIEVVCSNQAEHRSRVESRVTDVPGLKLPTWTDVLKREYDAWDRAHIVVDTAGQTPAESQRVLWRMMEPT
jgi:predicted kinase